MPGPYDYTVNIPQPPAQNFLQSLLGIQQLKGLQQQQDIQGQQAQQQAVTFDQSQQDRTRILQEQAAAKEQTQQLFKELQALPANAPIEDVVKFTNKLALINPPAAKQVNDNFIKLSEQYQNNTKIISTQAGSLLEAEKYQDAADLYNEAAKAVKDKAGNNQNLLDLAKGYEIQAKLSVSSPVAAKTGIATLLGVIDPQALSAITAARNQEAEAPLKAAQARLAKADARLKELKATGKLDSEETMKQENTMRSEFLGNPFLRTFPVRSQAYNEIITAERSPTGDGSKITSFIKLQDPSSVVSVTEKGQITSTTPIASLQALINKFTNNGILDDKTRNDIDKQSKNIFETAKASYQKEKNNTIAMAKRYGLNPDNIIPAYDTELQLPAEVTQTNKTEPAPRKKTGLPPAANNIFRTNIGGKSITVERE
jgi:hypothetical protein